MFNDPGYPFKADKELSDTGVSEAEVVIPADYEQLAEHLRKDTYTKAQAYWETEMGRKRNSVLEFNGKNFAARQSLINEHLDRLKNTPDPLEIDPESDVKISREKLIAETVTMTDEVPATDTTTTAERSVTPTESTGAVALTAEPIVADETATLDGSTEQTPAAKAVKETEADLVAKIQTAVAPLK